MTPRTGVADAAQGNALIGQPLIGIVGAQGQPVFGPRCEHPVRFGYSAGHKIIDHDTEVSIGPVEDDGIGLAGRQRGIQTGNKSLRCGLFIARGAIDLTSQE